MAPMTASTALARRLWRERPPVVSSPMPSSRWAPSPSSSPQAARDGRETRSDFFFDSPPSASWGYSSNSWWATTAASTESPKNTKHTKKAPDPLSLANDLCDSASLSRSGFLNRYPMTDSRVSAISLGSLLLGVGRDVVVRLADGLDLLGLLVRDLGVELLLESHHELD